MHSLITKTFNESPVRIVEIDGQPWFVAMDVCRVLGFHVKTDGTVNTTLALRHCNENEIITSPVSDKRGKPAKLISESGLYKLIMRSDKPQARAFQDWVTREVLPSIRKHGGYIAGQEKVANHSALAPCQSQTMYPF